VERHSRRGTAYSFQRRHNKHSAWSSLSNAHMLRLTAAQLLKVTKERPGASSDETDKDAVLLRAYGNNTDILIDRDREAGVHALLAERELAPPLLARFKNGLLYRFIPGEACTPQDLTNSPIWHAIARRLGEWHARIPVAAVVAASHAPQMEGHHNNQPTDGHPASSISTKTPNATIWSVMEQWVQALPSSTDKQRARQTLLRQELERSFHELDNSHGLGEAGLVVGHCDLLSGNVIILATSRSRDGNENDADVAFVDYEYAVPCSAAFDLANHFAEWGGFDCDYNMLPTRSIRHAFLKEYLDAYGQYSSEKTAPTLSVDGLTAEVDRYRGMPGLYWGIWALIQATISMIDFDYASYAEVRLGEYWAWRAESDNSRAKEGKEMPLRENKWAQE